MTSLLRALTPVPMALSDSRIRTSRPAIANCRATARPMTPAPMTAQSISARSITGSGLHRGVGPAARPGAKQVEAAGDDDGGANQHQAVGIVAPDDGAQQCGPDQAGIVEGRDQRGLAVAERLIEAELAAGP